MRVPRGLLRRLNALPLRSRLALLVAAAVAVAVAACATTAWFLVRAQLVSSLDDALRENRLQDRVLISLVESGRCRSVPAEERREVPNPFGSTVQIVDSDGGSCMVFGSQPLPVGRADVAVARGERQEVLHTVRASDGTGYRVLTTPLKGTSAAVSVARPLTEVDQSLDTLALVLGLVAAAGVLGAAGAGVALARAGLRPVDRLTAAVEHVARTEDLAVRIPVAGRDEIARLSQSFNAMTSALASSRDLQQQLIADAGHELRTPLTSLRTNVDLLVRSEETGRSLPPEDRAALLDSVRAQIAELSALIGDLQELSRPDAAPGGGQIEVVAWHETVERAVERVRLRSTGTGSRLVVDLAPWYVRAESAALERAVVNLLDNAVKFSPGDAGKDAGEDAGKDAGGDADEDSDADAGAVRVSLAEGVLSVRDHGPGVPADELPYVFDRFWRSPSARSLPGSGLGQSIVARTVRQAGGSVQLRPAEGGGMEAVVRLPGAATPPPELPA